MNLFRKKIINDFNVRREDFQRCLSAFDLTFLGIGAIIGHHQLRIFNLLFTLDNLASLCNMDGHRIGYICHVQS